MPCTQGRSTKPGERLCLQDSCRGHLLNRLVTPEPLGDLGSHLPGSQTPLTVQGPEVLGGTPPRASGSRWDRMLWAVWPQRSGLWPRTKSQPRAPEQPPMPPLSLISALHRLFLQAQSFCDRFHIPPAPASRLWLCTLPSGLTVTVTQESGRVGPRHLESKQADPPACSGQSCEAELQAMRPELAAVTFPQHKSPGSLLALQTQRQGRGYRNREPGGGKLQVQVPSTWPSPREPGMLPQGPHTVLLAQGHSTPQRSWGWKRASH